MLKYAIVMKESKHLRYLTIRFVSNENVIFQLKIFGAQS